MRDYDIVIVGGGLAGSMAALSATRARSDHSVALVTRDETTLQAASGLVDVLGYTPGGEGPISNPFERITDLPKDHPYATVGVERVRDGLSLFDDVAGETYGGGQTDRNALVPTHYGRVKPTARYPKTVEAGLASEERQTALVGFRRLTGLDVSLAASRLSNTLPYEVTGFDIRFPMEAIDGAGDPESLPVTVAEAFDRNPETDSEYALWETIVRRINLHRNVEERIGLPAVLGMARAQETIDYMEDSFGIRVFEVPMGPPSVPGYRLQALLSDALADAGVDVFTGQSVVDCTDSGDAVESITTQCDGTADDREQFQASEFVLATGGVEGGGVRADRTAVTEPVFGCHVDVPADRYEWADDDALGNHQFARFGVKIDDSLRPQTAEKQSEYRNLRAAGSVISGYNYAAEKSGSGVSIATGYVAGRLAAEHV